MNVPVGVGERVYRGFLRLYPADFRVRYADDMVQLFNDQLRDARTGHAVGGAVSAWLRLLGDVAVTAALEHLRRNRTVAHSLASAPPIQARLLGAAGILGGVVLLAAFLIEIPSDLNILRLILFNLGSIAIVLAVHRRQAAVAPTMALLGAVPALLANAWYLVMTLFAMGRVDPVFGGDFGLAYFWAGFAMWLTDAWFGLVTLRLGAVTRWGALAVAVGGLLAILGMDRLGLTSVANPTIFGTLALAGIAVLGLGLILLGVDVAMRRRMSVAGRLA